jgi:hypothetical protein
MKIGDLIEAAMVLSVLSIALAAFGNPTGQKVAVVLEVTTLAGLAVGARVSATRNAACGRRDKTAPWDRTI